MTARDLNGKQICVGARVFIDRQRESFPVIDIRPFTKPYDAYWIQVDDPVNGRIWYFNTSVVVDDEKMPGAPYCIALHPFWGSG